MAIQNQIPRDKDKFSSPKLIKKNTQIINQQTKVMETIRKTGIDIIGNTPWGTHFCQFYETKEDLIDILVPYFKAGLENNEFCMWITSDPLRVDDAKKALAKKVKKLDEYIQKGQIEILDSGQWYTKTGKFDSDEVLNGWLEKEHQAIKNGFDGLRLTGNTFWLEKKDWKYFTDYEETINNIIGNHRMIAICSYSLNRCDAVEIIDVVNNHQFGLIKYKGKWKRIESSEHKKTMESLKRSEERYKELTAGITDQFFALDNNLTIINWNKATEKITGIPEKEAIGKTLSDLFPKLKRSALEKTLLSAIKNQKQHNLNFKWKIKDKPIVFEVNIYPTIEGLSVFAIEITEKYQIEQLLRKSEEKYKYLYEESQSFNIIVGFDGTIKDLNKATLDVLGYRKKDVINTPITDYVPEKQKKLVLELFKKSIAGKPTPTTDLSIYARDGSIHTILFSPGQSKIYENDTPIGLIFTGIDITDRIQLQKEIKESEDKYRIVASNTYDFEFWIDPNGKYLYASPSCKNITGYSANEFMNDPELQRKSIHPDDLAIYNTHIREEVKKQNPGLTEWRIIHTDGSTRWISHVCQPIYDDDRRYVGVRGSNRDITESKKVEKALQESEERLRLAQVSAHVGVWDWNTQTNELFFTPELNQLYGLPAGTIKTYRDWRDLAHSDDIDRIETDRDEAIANKRLFDLEFRILHSSGEFHWINAKGGAFYNKEGKAVRVIGVNIDITERKHMEETLQNSEERFRLAQRAAHIGNWDWNVLTNSLEWSEEMEIIFGFKPGTFGKTYESFLNCVHSDDRLSVDSSVRASLEKGSPYDIVYRIVQHGKKIRWISATGDVIQNEKGNAIRMLGIVQDITDRKLTVATLQETRKYLENLLNYANAPIIVWNSTFEITIFNHAFERLTSYKADKVIGQKLSILFPQESRKESLIKIVKTLSGEQWEIVEIPILCKNGDIRLVLWNSANIYDNSGKVLVATIAQGQDITERKRTEEELVRLASFPENNPNPIIEIDFSGAIHYSNHKSKELFPGIEKIGFHHPYLKGLDKLILNIQKERKYQSRSREIKVDKSYYLQTFYYVPDKQRIRIYSTDITERKKAEDTLQESEEKYRRIVEHTTNVIMVTKPDGIISYLSPSSTDIFGYEPEELVGTNPNIFYPDDTKKVMNGFNRALKGEKGSNLEYRIVTKQGQTKWISHSWSPVLIGNNLHSVISVIEDIDQRKMNEENIQQLNNNLLNHSIELAAANKELEAFSYSVSHDLRAPLRSIDGFSQALLEDYSNVLDEQGADYIRRVRNATQKMGQLIDDMLRLSRLTRAELFYEKIDFSGLAQEIIEKLQNTDQSRKVRIKIQEGMFVKGDKKLLEVLLDNLLGNAWKFTSKTKHSTIDVGETTKDKETVYYVRDNGAGFDMEYSDKLFVPFQRLHSTDEFSGTGIGLAIVSRIVHRHGGKIWAEGKVGKGATFYFTFRD